VVLILSLIVVNFQSWTDPFVIITACLRRWPALSGCCSPPAPLCRCGAHRRHHVMGVHRNSILVTPSPRAAAHHGDAVLARWKRFTRSPGLHDRAAIDHRHGAMHWAWVGPASQTALARRHRRLFFATCATLLFGRWCSALSMAATRPAVPARGAATRPTGEAYPDKNPDRYPDPHPRNCCPYAPRA